MSDRPPNRSGLVECPHCHVRVLSMADNRCPACKNDISDTQGVDLSQVALTIHEGQALPPFCHSCNTPTERYVSLEYGAAFRQVSSTVSMGERPVRQPKRPAEAGTTTIYIDLPQCDRCAETSDPEILQIDFDAQSMTFLVHRDFRTRVHLLLGMADPAQGEVDEETEDNQEISDSEP